MHSLLSTDKPGAQSAPLIRTALALTGSHARNFSIKSLVSLYGSVMDSPRKSDIAFMGHKQVLLWKEVRIKSIRGTDVSVGWPALIDIYYRGRLLPEILEMPKATPISMAEAIQKFVVKWYEEVFIKHCASDVGLKKSFVSWISSQGFHIEITGDEFESCVISDKFA